MIGSSTIANVLKSIRMENMGTLPPLLVVSDDSNTAKTLLQSAYPELEHAESLVVTSNDVSRFIASNIQAVDGAPQAMSTRQVGLVSSLVDQVTSCLTRL
jgi:hypothetical protein